MTDAEWKALEMYVTERAHDLALKDWKIRLERIPTEEKDDGAFYQFGDSRSAAIRVTADFKDLSAQRQREVLLHELLHLHLVAITDCINDLYAAGVLSKQQRDVAHEDGERNKEFAIDAISNAIAPKFPLIEWPEKDKANESS